MESQRKKNLLTFTKSKNEAITKDQSKRLKHIEATGRHRPTKHISCLHVSNFSSLTWGMR